MFKDYNIKDKIIFVFGVIILCMPISFLISISYLMALFNLEMSKKIFRSIWYILLQNPYKDTYYHLNMYRLTKINKKYGVE